MFNMNLNKIVWRKFFKRFFQIFFSKIIVTKVVKKQVDVARVILFTFEPFTCENFYDAFSKYGFNFEFGD
jgi:hypothetical protein